jgi:uncharacterized membrane protein
MMEFLYQTLAKIGYTHPIHPPVTHIPVGMVIGAFLFALVAWLVRHERLAVTARHCVLLGLMGLFPTALLGYMDWQHRYGGAWSFPIKMKIGLAVLLMVLLIVALILGRNLKENSIRVLVVYGLCLLNATALGYFGGELIYGGSGPLPAAETEEIQVSAEQFNKSCRACHPGGGNSIKANFPLRSAPQLADFNTFLAYIRNPKARDGSQTIMPAFPVEQLSDIQAREIYQYVIQVLRKR